MDTLATKQNISSTGQGERLCQTADGVTTHYIVDLNTGGARSWPTGRAYPGTAPAG